MELDTQRDACLGDVHTSEAQAHTAAVRAYVQPFIDHRDRYLAARAVHGSPLYLFEEAVVLDRVLQFRRAFQAHLPAIDVFYALKSNGHPAIVQTLLGAGCGLDVSSGKELAQALSAGAAAIIFSGPGKTDVELRAAIRHPDRVTLLIDSFGELERLGRLTSGPGPLVHIGVRLTTDERGLWRKFGIPLERLADFGARAALHERLSLEGLQFHTSWNLNAQAQVAFLERLGRVLADLPTTLRSQFRFLDIGGGYWPQPGEWLPGAPDGSRWPERQPAISIEQFAAAIAIAIQKAIRPHIQCRIWAEPGRWICNDAMHILATVIDCKAADLVITDAGTNSVGWERYAHEYFPVINLSQPDATEHACLILGSLCTPHDLWGHAYCGARIEPGDALLIPNQGAYTYCLRQEFIKPLPTAVVFATDER